MKPKNLILIVDDDLSIAKVCADILSDAGYDVLIASNGEIAIRILEYEIQFGIEPSLLITDLKMENMGGLELLQKTRLLFPSLPSIVITGHATLDNAIIAMRLGARYFLKKPFNVEELINAVEEAILVQEESKNYVRIKTQLPFLKLTQKFIRHGYDLDLDFIFKLTLEIIQENLEIERGIFLLMDEKSKTWKPSAIIGENISEDFWKDFASIESQINLQYGSPLVLDNKIVIFRDKQPHFILILERNRERGYALFEIELLSILSDQISLMLDTIFLHNGILQAEKEWRATFNAITDYIAIIDEQGSILKVNQALIKKIGLEEHEIRQKKLYEFIPIQNILIDIFNHFLSQKKEFIFSTEISSSLFKGIFEISAYPLEKEPENTTTAVLVIKDITKTMEFQRRLVQSEKLTALGRLTATLAHEINNPLQALQTGLNLLRKGQYSKEKQKIYLEAIYQEIERLITVTEQTLNFCRTKPEQELEFIDVNQIIHNILQLLEGKLNHNHINVKTILSSEIPLILSSKAILEQVFLNIIFNAIEAMPNGGQLTIQSGNNSSNEMIWVSFKDTGIGIPQSIQERIFEPFYTTKPNGTGLGLSVSHSLIEKYGGYIDFESHENVGSLFTVYLPYNWRSNCPRQII